MEYQRIKYFLAAAKLLNFTEAARQLYISPQALAKQITLLEQELGVRLFERTTRSVKLTKPGEVCKQRFWDISIQMEDTIREIRSIEEKDSIKTTVGIFSALPKKEIIAPIINLIYTNFPNLRLEVIMEDLTLMKEDLYNEKLDLCITNSYAEEKWGDVKKINIASYSAKIVVSLYHPWVIKDKITVDDMKQMTFLGLLKPEPPNAKSFYRNVTCKERILLPNFDTMLTYLERGNAFAVFPQVFDQRLNERLKYFDIPEQNVKADTICVCLKNNKKREVKDILNLIEEEFLAK